MGLDKINRERLRYLSRTLNTTSIEIEKALDFKYGHDNNRDLNAYTDNDIKEAIKYYYSKKFK